VRFVWSDAGASGLLYWTVTEHDGMGKQFLGLFGPDRYFVISHFHIQVPYSKMIDLALLAISRLILLDAFLLFFTASATFCYVRFHREQLHRPFSDDWWIWLILTGLNLGLVSSIKWVGLCTVAVVGVLTVIELWQLLGNVQLPLVSFSS
jgi:hypothetical protein